jgi:hypothetical protein
MRICPFFQRFDRGRVSRHDAWVSTAATTLALAEGELAAGRTESARLAFWRSSSYFRTAGVMLMGAPLDSRLVESNAAQADAFRRGAALLAVPPEIIQIPYEGTSLPGYFFRVDDQQAPRATVILTGGYDGTAEELYFFNGAAALARGYNVLAFDGPGQGAALLQQGISPPGWLAAGTRPLRCCGAFSLSWSASPPPDGPCGEASLCTAPPTPSWPCAITH